ncbi:site-specific DNA recombinase [Caloranaerobacter azorensis DSM 13643]|uniref:Site-specific DNA recombinase n=1 Tax=Caloranaerobacter azorensis DSM 13643 TaxID=1121264 RepID=A0A1M5TSU4_9FIRM|nr:recombinase family protein [Caloranaerobacter azorensis]SHH53885.1 site-specific DNA recombinase [Caloranaerobacter azorensis DSM 13643]
MRIAIYSRKSKFTGKGESTQNQIEMCKEYAKKHFANIEDFLIYEDEGFSGGNTDRPEYRRMIKDARNGKFDVLMCYRLDRISRNIADFSDTIEILQDNDIAFVSVREQFDTSTPMGRAMMYIASVFAQLERETIAERIRDNMLQLARSGRWLGGRTPLGYKSEPIEYYDADMNKRKMYKLSAIPEELKLVKILYKKFLEFGTLTKLESWTLENNIKTRSNNYFDRKSLKLILTNPVYLIADELAYEYFKSLKSDIACSKNDFDGIHGLMVFNKHQEKKSKVIRKDEEEWIIAVGKHKGIIESKDWIQVQNLIKENSKKAPRAGTGQYGLITPLLKCSCGSKMRVSINKKSYGTYYYYKCLMKERSRGSRCNVKNLNGKATDELIINELKKMAKSDSELMKNLERRRNNISNLKSEAYCKKKELEKELAEKEKAIRNLTIQLSQNESSTAAKYIIEQIENLDKEIKKIKDKLYNINEKEEINLIEKNNLDMIKDLLKHFANTVDNLNFEEKKKFLRQIVNEIVWDGKKLEINIIGQDR